MTWLDLHMHTRRSGDGEFAPAGLMDLCRRAGVRCAAVADHNTVRGLREARETAEALGIELIPAVELDCTHRNVDLHVLGYGIDPDEGDFAAVERDVLEQEIGVSRQRMRRVADLGIALDEAEIRRLAPDGAVAGEIIAEVALALESNAGNPLLLPYRPGGRRGDNPYVNFYWDFCARGKPAYVPLRYMDLSSAVRLIRKAGGVAVLAHPGNNIGEDEELLRDIAAQGVEGVEVYSSYHSPSQTAFYRDRAKELALLVTCGSDFHGKTKPAIALGSVDCEGRETEISANLKDRIRK